LSQAATSARVRIASRSGGTAGTSCASLGYRQSRTWFRASPGSHRNLFHQLVFRILFSRFASQARTRQEGPPSGVERCKVEDLYQLVEQSQIPQEYPFNGLAAVGLELETLGSLLLDVIGHVVSHFQWPTPQVGRLFVRFRAVVSFWDPESGTALPTVTLTCQLARSCPLRFFSHLLTSATRTIHRLPMRWTLNSPERASR